MADPDTFRVSPSLQGMPRVDAPPVESATPGLLVRAGQAVQRAGQVGSEMYRQVLREQNATRVTEALTELTQYQHDLTYGGEGIDGWAAQMGKNALERPSELSLDDEYGSQFDTRVENITTALGNDAQRQLFRERAQAMGIDLRGRIQEHVARQGLQYRQDTLTGVIESGQRLMGTATDPLDQARATEMTRQAASQLAGMRGLPEEAEKAFYREMLTPGHIGALSRMQAAEDIEGAENYFNAHRDELTLEAATRVEASLLEQRAIMEGGEIGEAIAGLGMAQSAAAAPQQVGMPVYGNYTVTGQLGDNRGDHRHGGVDWAMPVGTPVYAGATGVAHVKRDPDGYGLYVDLTLDDGTVLRSAHLSDTDIEDGQRVAKGQQIASSGNSGSSTGPHLHYEVIDPQGTKLDPLRWHQNNPMASTGQQGASLQDMLQQLYQRNLPPRQEQEAERKIRSLWGARRDAETEQREEALSRAYAEIDRTGKLSDSTRSALVGAGLGASIPSLRSFETATANRAAGGTVSDEDGLIAYGTVKQMIAEGRVSSVEDLLPMKPYLPDKYYKQLVDDVSGSPQDARSQADRVINMMNEEIAGTGLFVDEDGNQTPETKRRYSRFVGQVTRQIEVERANGPVTAAREREIVLGMLGQSSINSLGVRLRGFEVRRLYDQIDPAIRGRGERALQRAGTPVPSQAQVVDWYLRRYGSQ